MLSFENGIIILQSVLCDKKKLSCIQEKLWYNSTGDTMNREHIEKIAKTSEDRMLLAKLWDKIQGGIHRNIPTNTCFLSLREQEMARFLFGQPNGLFWFGGYEESERKMLCYLPEYYDSDWLYDEDSPIVCLRASFYQGASPTHRDFLGAIMNLGIEREVVGDIAIKGKKAYIKGKTAMRSSLVVMQFLFRPCGSGRCR